MIKDLEAFDSDSKTGFNSDFPHEPPPAYPAGESQVPAPQKAKLSETVSLEDRFARLSEFETVILLDDSSSMKYMHGEVSRWEEARQALMWLAPTATAYDKSGIDIFFLNDKKSFKRLKTSKDVAKAFSKVKPNGTTNLGCAIEGLLDKYIWHKRSPSSPNKWPAWLNLIVITDGAPTDSPEDVIVNAARRLDREYARLAQVGIQFVQIGGDTFATEFLRRLDDDLVSKHAIRDIVDTTAFANKMLYEDTDTLTKALLGGVDRALDNGDIQF